MDVFGSIIREFLLVQVDSLPEVGFWERISVGTWFFSVEDFSNNNLGIPKTGQRTRDRVGYL
jgi:hypothetical protein